MAAVAPNIRSDLSHEHWILHRKLFYFGLLHTRVLPNVLGPAHHSYLQVPEIKSAQLQQNPFKPLAKNKSD